MLLALAPVAAGALPAAKARALLADLGFTPGEIARVEAGELVNGDPISSSPRELVASFAFRIDAAPARVVGEIRSNLLADVPPTVVATGEIHGDGSLADFAAFTLGSDPAAAADAYIRGSSDLNLSREELAAFAKLSDPRDVEQQVRVALLERVRAYRAKGLDGIAPYVHDGDERSPADELRSASKDSESLATYAPIAWALLQGYPAGKPDGLEETIRWREFAERGVPTIHVEHEFLVDDGDVRTAVERQFYVSAGYNCAQSIALFVPTSSGTIVVYTHRTSTDQVAGIGGSIRRAIGSRMLASHLESTLQNMQKEMKER